MIGQPLQALLHPYEKSFVQLVHALANFNWGWGSFVILTPLISVYGLFVSPFYLYTCILNAVCCWAFLLGISAGYHRLWAHKAYETNKYVKLLWVLLGGAAFNMSVVDFVKDDRAHHRYTDTTDKDPHNAKKGFWHSHIGWLLTAREKPNSDVSDILADPVLCFQHRYYAPLAFSVGWGIPILIAGLGWGDWTGGFYVGVMRTVIAQHITFSINSFAHWGGGSVYSDQLSARENPWLAIITLGEGYHNFHHEFPNDYRNGVNWYAIDFPKWVIASLELFGFAWNVCRTPKHLIEKAKIQTALKLLQEKREKFFWGKAIKALPTYTREQVKKEFTEKGACWVIMENVVYDVSGFLPQHPGGETILKAYLGKDITKEFRGAVYVHTNSARSILDTLRVGTILDEPKVR